MNHVFSTNQSTTVKSQSRVATIALWTLQSLLALVFVFMGSMKLTTPIEVMMAQMALPLPGWFIQFIGVAEVAGGLGLILPMLFRVLPGLTPLAAACLVVIMIGATVVTLISGGGASALMPLVLGILLALVVYGRRDRFALTFKRSAAS